MIIATSFRAQRKGACEPQQVHNSEMEAHSLCKPIGPSFVMPIVVNFLVPDVMHMKFAMCPMPPSYG